MRSYKPKEKQTQSNNSHWVEDGGWSKVSHLVVTTTGFIIALDTFSTSSVSTHFCTLFPWKSNHQILHITNYSLVLVKAKMYNMLLSNVFYAVVSQWLYFYRINPVLGTFWSIWKELSQWYIYFFYIYYLNLKLHA